MSKLNLFIPITKIDEDQRLVYGRIAAEEVDNSGEVFDYQSSKPNFEKWSNDQSNASNGLSKGNVRAMHGTVAAGMLTDIHFDDDSRVIEGCAKIVDDNEWKKCLAGVYTGFSVGGRYERRWTEGGMRKYTALPAEVSIVDKPCIKSARFADLIKSDGSHEQLELGKAWDESKHPRHPKGASDGGKFASSAGRSVERGEDIQRGPTDEEAEAWERENPDTAEVPGPESGNTWNERVADASAEVREEAVGLVHSALDQTHHHLNDEMLRILSSQVVDMYGAGEHGKLRSYLHTTLGLETKEARAAVYAALKQSVSKGDAMYEPTNDEMLARAQVLAKAAGKTDADWLDFKDEARTAIIAEHDGTDLTKADAPVHTDEDCKVGDGCEKCAGMEKADKADDTGTEKAEGEGDDVTKADVPELSQGWRAKDGSFHLKKADAIAHNESLGAGPTLADQLSGLRADLGKSDGDVDPVEAALAIVAKFDGDQLAKFASAEDAPLTKFIADAVAAGRTEERDELTKSDGLLLKVDDPAVAEKLAKVDTLTTENEVLQKKVGGLEKQIADAAPAIAELRKDIAAIRAMPIPGGPATTDVRTVDKGQDRLGGGGGGDNLNKGDLLGLLNKAITSGELKAEDVADAAIRASQQNPTRVAY